MSQEQPNKEILSIEHNDDEKGYVPFSEYLENHTERVRKREADAIDAMGESLLMEIDHKNTIKDAIKEKQIKYIVKKTSKYSGEYLLELDYRDVLDIFNEVRYENRSFWTKLKEKFNLTRH